MSRNVRSPAPLSLLAAVVLCALLAYGPAVAGDFVYDDHHSVEENSALDSLSSVPRYFVDVTAFSSLDNRMYRPVLLTTFAVDHAIGGGSPWAFKLTNVLLHALAAGLLWGLARRLGATAMAATAGAVAFAVHPLASEAVNMVSARSELLCIVALLAAMHCHLLARSGRRVAHVGTVMAGLVACGSKETGVVLPALLLALEWLAPPMGEGGTKIRTVLRRVLPAAIVAVCYLVLRKVLFGTAVADVGHLVHGSDPRTGHGRGIVTQLATMAAVLPGHLLQLVWPAGLSLDPPVHFQPSLWAWPVLLGAGLMGTVVALGLRGGRRGPLVTFGTVLACVTAAPWVLLPLNAPIEEHRFYGPLAGAALVVAGVWPRWSAKARPRVATVAAAAVAVLGVLSAARSLGYRDEVALWRSAFALDSSSYRACYSIGACLMKDGDLVGAKTWFLRALDRYPDYVSAHKNVAEVELQLEDRGDPERARREADWLLARAPDNPFYRLLSSRALAAVAQRTGDASLFDAAVDEALSVLDVAAPKGLVYRTAAHARRIQGRLEDALALLDQSIARGLDHVDVLFDRYQVLLRLGRQQDAELDLRRALQQAPFDPVLLNALASLRTATPR